jgi:hypothetical protein
MAREKVVFVRCSFLRGGFPTERVFVIRFANGAELRGVAPVHYCYTKDREPLGDQPPKGGEVDGLVVGIAIKRLDGDTVRVHLPDGDIYELGDAHIVSVREEIEKVSS